VVKEECVNLNSVKDALAWAERELVEAGIDFPRRTAEVLLAFAVKRDRVWILAHPEAPLSRAHIDLLRDLTERRKSGQPLQYITGYQEFFGRRFRVSAGVLIPRPETELLVEKTIELGRDLGKNLRFVDVGTGSGCIAVSVACGLAGSLGFAVDISFEALGIARQNASMNGAEDRIQFVCADLLNCFPPEPAFHFILSNPPYVSRREADLLPREVRDYEPDVALFSGESGLEIYRPLVRQAAPRLSPGGCLLMEVGAGQSEEVKGIAEEEGLFPEAVLEDLRGIPRCVVARKG